MKLREVIDGKVACSCCKEFKEFSEFFKSKGKRLGIESSCKACSMKKKKNKVPRKICSCCGEAKSLKLFGEDLSLCKKCTRDEWVKSEDYKIHYRNKNIRVSKRREEEARVKVKSKLKDIIENHSEGWAFIPGFDEKYQASVEGKIRRLPYVYRTDKGILSYKLNIHNVVLISHKGYLQARLVNKKGVSFNKGVHRWVMLAFHGDSDLSVDHINGIRDDNRLENLRYLNASDNINHIKTLNKGKFSSDLHGVRATRGKWVSYITVNKKEVYLGLFIKEEDAHEAYKKAKFNLEVYGIEPEKYIPPYYTSKSLGVGFHKVSGKWRVRFNRVYIGLFLSECVATKVYNIIDYMVKKFNVELTKELIEKIKNKYGTL